MEQAAKVAPGLKFIYDECLKHYPNQPDPLQANTLIKYWQGGPDPLDYISMYKNPGNPDLQVPPHWHYISYGLTDLYGDNRVHHRAPTDNDKSGFGFELTFRLKAEPDEAVPPVWPAKLMQQLAKYVFASGNTLWHGDHVSWHQSLDGSESRITQMLMHDDVQLEPVRGPFGVVEFVQIIGITTEELDTVQQWNGPSLLALMQRYHQCGGEYLVTDMRRGESLFELDEGVREEVSNGIDNDGSNLSGVSAKCDWLDNAWSFYTEDDLQYLTPVDREKVFKVQGWNRNTDSETEGDKCPKPLSRSSSEEYLASVSRRRPNDSLRMSTGESTLDDLVKHQKGGLCSSVSEEMRMSCESTHSNHSHRTQQIFGEIEEPMKTWDNMHIYLNLEASLIIPLALKGRLRHGRHFTFKSGEGNLAITLVAPQVRGSFASVEHPFRSKGTWLHVCMPEELIDDVLKDFENAIGNEMALPKTLLWPQWHFALTIAL